MFLQFQPDDFPTLGRFTHEPSKHPEFVRCDDPRLEGKAWAPLPVYVPSLVQLIHRLGGLKNIPRLQAKGGADYRAALILDRGADTLDARVEVVLCGGAVRVSSWHPNRDESSLEVHFQVPETWTTGEWQVTHVMEEDLFALSDAVRREVADLCDRVVGMLLVDPWHAIAVGQFGDDPMIPDRILRLGTRD